MLAISYMGTKRPLAPLVADLASDCQPGPCLDLFAGMCAVGQGLASSRPIWSNDLQTFASLVAKCQFCSTEDPPDSHSVEIHLGDNFNRHMRSIERDHSHELLREQNAFVSEDVDALLHAFESRIFVANRIHSGSGSPHKLFLERYAGTYFGLRQCAEIDSLRYAIDTALGEGDLRNWCLVALCSALSRCASTTGHFAQPLAPKPNNVSKMVSQRRRSIWEEFLDAVARLTALGSQLWRTRNRVFQADALSLLRERNKLADVRLVYADPPYTSDQYSRYYHIYETLILYDYPAARGRGLYRDDRAVSSFSHATKVSSSIERLIACVRDIGADLILSYPSNGLLPNSRERLIGMFQHYYGRSPDIVPLVHNHSTFGASKGAATHQVVEFLYRASACNATV